MTIQDAQKDIDYAYFGGAPGMLVSGVVWLTAGIIGFNLSIFASVITLFIGGMLIQPLSMVISKALGRPGNHTKGNPLAMLALESTFLLFIGLFLAFAMVQVDDGFFFPIMLLIIGGRYLVFSTLYGQRLYWAIGGILAIAGMLALMFSATPIAGAFIGGGIEIVGAAILFVLARSAAPPN